MEKSGEKNSFLCNVPNCHKRFESLLFLQQHLKSHQATKPFKCNYDGCNKTFSQYSSLQKHERTHNGQKPFTCGMCSKSFTQISNLRRHERMHNGVRPHTCTICQKSFLTSSNLKQHLQTHINKEVRDKYECPTCLRIFNYKSSLKKHQKEHRNQIIADSLTNDNSIKKKIVTERLKENSNDPDEKIKTYPQEREIQIINQINQNIFCSLFASMQQNWQITNPYSIVNRELLKLKMDLNPHINEILTNEITIQIKHKDHFDYLYRGRLFNIKDSYIEEHFFDEDTQNSTICKPLKEISHIPSLSMMKSKYEQITQNYGIPLDNLSSLNSCTALTCGGPKNSKVSDEEKPQTLQSSTGSVQGNEEDLITTKDKILTSLSANDEKETSDCSTTGKCCCQSKNGDIHDNSKSECCTGEKETNREKSDIKKSVKFAMNQKQSTGSCCQNKSSLMCGSACQKSCQPKSEKSSSKKNQGGCCQKSTLDTGCGCSSRDNSCFCSLTKVLKHHHSLTCGHPYIIHKGHLDFIVEGRLHHPHDDHCDDHGLLEILDPSFDGLDQDIENNL